MPNEKLPPVNVEFESFIIGGLMLSGEMQPHVGEALSTVDMKALADTGLTAEDFHDDRARAAFIAILHLPSITLTSALATAPKLRDYLRRCYTDTPSPTLCVPSAREVHRMAISRQLIQIAGAIAQMAYEDKLEPKEALEKIDLLMATLPQRTKPTSAIPYKGIEID